MRHPLIVILNPNARRLRKEAVSAESLRRDFGEYSKIYQTETLEELDDLMRSLGNSGMENQTLCFYGGDGSVGHGITCFLRAHGPNASLPRMLTVRAGTINMLCNVLGFHERPEHTFGFWERGELTAVREIPTLKIEVEGDSPRYGFVFAWGIGYRVLREYYGSGSPNFLDGLKVAVRTFRRALEDNANESEFFRGEDIALKIEGKNASKDVVKTRALTVGTLPEVSLGLKPFPLEPVRPGAFHVSANAMPLGKVARHAPSLLLGWADQRKLDFGDQLIARAQVSRISCFLSEGFTLDGEMISLPKSSQVTISAGPAARFWIK